MEGYAAQHGFLNCVHYTDDGWSGGNFDRPSWKQLVADVEAGKVGTVLVKDMSRIGRDYLQTGYFNALLRELKDLVAMLTEFVADAADSFADHLTKLREKLIVICYQIKAIIRSRDKRTATIQATQPKLKRYNELTQQIRQKTKARKALVAEQKNTSKLNLIKQHDLSRQITTLTEEIEELRSEKENLLLDLGCADDAGVKAVQSEVTAMEASLHKLDEQKEKYSVELDETLQQYKQLQSQAEAEDQQKIRTDAAAAASARLQQAYGKHYNAQLARESQQDVAAWLGESTQPASIREQLQLAAKKTPRDHSKDENVAVR